MAEEDALAAAMFGPAEQATLADAMFGSPQEDVSQLRAAGMALNSGLTSNFYDELQGLEAASGMPKWAIGQTPVGAARLGWEKLTGKGAATERYEETVKRARAEQKAGEKQWPITSMAGELAGAVAQPLPFAKLAPGAKLADWAKQGVKIGAMSGAASGLGEGEGLGDSLTKGITGGSMGAVLGAPLGAGVGALVNKFAGKAAGEAGDVANKVAGEAAEATDDLAPRDPVTRLTTALREIKPLREDQEKIYHERRAYNKLRMDEIDAQNLPGMEGHYEKLKVLKGPMEKVDNAPGVGHLFDEADITDFFGRIRKSDLSTYDRLDAEEGLSKLLGFHHSSTVPTRGELAHLEQVFGKDFVDAAQSNRGALREFWEDVGQEIINIPRALMASSDLSATFRQAIPLGAAHPVKFARAIKDMHKFAVSEEGYQTLYKAIEDGKSSVTGEALYPIKKEAGLALTHIDAADLTSREEKNLTNLPESIPGFGKLYRGSNRAYTGLLTKLRSDVFDSVWETMERNGNATPENAAKLADYINTFSGRGQWSFKYGTQAHTKEATKALFEKSMPVMNALFFSPRLMASRGKLVTNLANPAFHDLPKEVYADALRAYAGMGGSALTLLGLAKWAGADVVDDPKSADFAKVKVGNTRYEISGGVFPYIVLGTRLYTGKATSSQSGRTMTAGEGFKAMTRAEMASRFLEGKLSPTAGLALRGLRQQGYLGKPYSAQSEALEATTPMTAQDLFKLHQEYGGQWGGLKPYMMALPGFYGVGSNTYGTVQFEEGKDKLGLPAAKIGPKQDWGEYASENASKGWKRLFGEAKQPIDSTRAWDMLSFYRENYSKMPRDEQRRFEAKLAREYPDLDKKWTRMLRDERELKITPQEWDLRVKPIPERVEAVRKELDALPTYEEKRKLWGRYSQKGMGIITDEVFDRMRKLGAIPKVDPTNKISEKNQRQLETMLDALPRRSGGRIPYAQGGAAALEALAATGLRHGDRFVPFSEIGMLPDWPAGAPNTTSTVNMALPGQYEQVYANTLGNYDTSELGWVPVEGQGKGHWAKKWALGARPMSEPPPPAPEPPPPQPEPEQPRQEYTYPTETLPQATLPPPPSFLSGTGTQWIPPVQPLYIPPPPQMRQDGGRLTPAERRRRVGGGEYTEEEIRASNQQDKRFMAYITALSNRMESRGSIGNSWRRSTNIEDRAAEEFIPDSLRYQRRANPRNALPPVTDLSIQAGYDDIDRARGGKIKKTWPSKMTVPESAATLKRQQQALIAGKRAAMLYPHKAAELALPKGIRRIKTKDGLLHFSPKKLTPSQIKKASAEGRLNEILELGPVTKEEALARTMLGERPVSVAERSPDGVELKAAMGTEATAPAQMAALQQTALPGSTVAVEEIPETLSRRGFWKGGRKRGR